VVIFGQGRTGSTLLESLLCSTGHFHKTGELLNKDNGEIFFPANFILGMSKSRPKNNFIFHVKIYQLTRDRKRPTDPGAFLERINREGFKIIYIRRKNTIKQCLSNYVARERGAFHKFDDIKENNRISINCESFCKWVKERMSFNYQEKNAIEKLNFLEVVYEDDLESMHHHQRTVDMVLDYLTLERKEAFTKHRKVNTLPMKKLILNYKQFVRRLKEHNWQHFID
jgi:LPS sulfotransferase NodH